ncbi:MAG: tRNA pseudouridine(55) synthase, partial [Lachnospiraceae bacterium]|nr:tRNA pseudouridine(55) synthase [Lachnospiraceae bacterium]
VIRVALRIACEKGTYIRTICADIGRKLGCGGCMERLLRTISVAFKIEDSHSLAELEEIFAKTSSQEIQNVLLSADTCFMEYPALHCKEKYDSVLLNGNLMRMRHFKVYIEVADPINRVFDSHNDFKELYEWVEERKLYRPLKVFISTKE